MVPGPQQRRVRSPVITTSSQGEGKDAAGAASSEVGAAEPLLGAAGRHGRRTVVCVRAAAVACMHVCTSCRRCRHCRRACAQPPARAPSLTYRCACTLSSAAHPQTLSSSLCRCPLPCMRAGVEKVKSLWSCLRTPSPAHPHTLPMHAGQRRGQGQEPIGAARLPCRFHAAPPDHLCWDRAGLLLLLPHPQLPHLHRARHGAVGGLGWGVFGCVCVFGQLDINLACSSLTCTQILCMRWWPPPPSPSA